MKDRIIHSKLIQWIAGWKLSKKLGRHRFLSRFFNYEFISYLVVGVLTTAVNYVFTWICKDLIGMPIVPANTIAFVVSVTFAYFANKIFVFDSPSWRLSVIWKEFTSFVVSRLLAWGIETLVLWITVDLLHWPWLLMKVLTSIFVVIVNYFTSRFSFKTAGKLGRKKDSAPEASESAEQKTEEGSNS